MPERTVFGISDAARRVGVAENTLRRYESRGVISPARTPTGQRIYFQADVDAALAHTLRDRRRRAGE